ncbi:MAG: hypothetical protein JEZ08_15830 [Clostridiales bacterium]|nr:hypothetical protein [Clostridiales bacterium]
MFKKIKNSNTSQPDPILKESYSTAIIDYLNNDFTGTVTGVKSVILSIFEQNYLTIAEKHVNLGTPWAPEEADIIQLALNNSFDPDNLTIMEDHMIKWLIFTFGDGVYTNLTQVLQDVNKKDFIQANQDMFRGYNNKLKSVAKQLNLITDKPTPYGLKQQEFYQTHGQSSENSLKLVYGEPIEVNELLQTLLNLFDQTL